MTNECLPGSLQGNLILVSSFNHSSSQEALSSTSYESRRHGRWEHRAGVTRLYVLSQGTFPRGRNVWTEF